MQAKCLNFYVQSLFKVLCLTGQIDLSSVDQNSKQDIVLPMTDLSSFLLIHFLFNTLYGLHQLLTKTDGISLRNEDYTVERIGDDEDRQIA